MPGYASCAAKHVSTAWPALLLSAFSGAKHSITAWPAHLFSAVSVASACERTGLRSAKQQEAIATQSSGVERSPTNKAREGRMRIRINLVSFSLGRGGQEGVRPSSSPGIIPLQKFCISPCSRPCATGVGNFHAVSSVPIPGHFSSVFPAGNRQPAVGSFA